MRHTSLKLVTVVPEQQSALFILSSMSYDGLPVVQLALQVTISV